tara:strand:- start:2202 stop:2621 length:420 start_codon:yes stop_codon:yes gene_type:complete
MKKKRIFEQSSNKRKELLKDTAKHACGILGFIPGGSRLKRNVQCRAALSNAFQPYCTQDEIAEIIQRDRTTVSYYQRIHQDNEKYWDGYGLMFSMIRGPIAKGLGSFYVKESLNEIESQIAELIQARDKVKDAILSLEV